MDLARLLTNDNALRAAAEVELASLKGSMPNTLLKYLFNEIATSSQQQDMKERVAAMTMSLILLRGMAIREKSLFESLSRDEFIQCRFLLLGAVSNEFMYPHLRRTLCNTIAAIAGIDPNWPELMQFIQTQLSSPSYSQPAIQMVLFLLEKLAEHVGPLLIANLDHILQWIASSLQDSSALNGAQNNLKTRTAAALALFSLSYEVPAAVAERTTSYLGHAIDVMELTIQAGESELTQDIFIALSLLVEQRPQVFQGTWQKLLEILARVCNSPAGDEKVDDDMKMSALQIATSMLLNPLSSPYCSHPETRTVFLNIAMTFIASIEDHTDAGFFLRADTEDGFGDSQDEDSCQDQLSAYGAQCLDSMSKGFSSEEIVHTCLSAAWKLVSNNTDWRARRTALFVTATICEGAQDAMYALLPQIVPHILHLVVTDPHPRVRYSALHCLVQLVHEFPGEEDDDDDDDSPGTSVPSFQTSFLPTLPAQICLALQNNLEFPRIAATATHLLRCFFDPDRLDGEHEILSQLMDFCLTYISAAISGASAHPLFVIEEMITLLGNISLLMPETDLHARYDTLVYIFKGIIGSLAPAPIAIGGGSSEAETEVVQKANGLGENMLKCKALEAFALVGRAAGMERFYPDSIALLNLFAEVLPQIDASDPLSSYIMQSAARISGVIGSHFLPFVPHLIPMLIFRIGEPIDIEVTADDDVASAAGLNGKDHSDVTTVYQRGIGNVSFLCNSFQITDKEMSCRILYQFLLEIPSLIAGYVPDIMRAVIPLVDQRFVFSEECANVISSCVSEALGVYLKHTVPPQVNHPDTVSMIEYSLTALCDILDRQQKIEKLRGEDASLSAIPTSSGLSRISAVVCCFRDCFNSISKNQARWQLSISLDLLTACLLSLRNEMLMWMQRKFQHSEHEDLELEEDIRVNVSDALGWIMRILQGDQDALALQTTYTDEVEPFLSSEPYRSLFMPEIDDDGSDEDDV